MVHIEKTKLYKKTREVLSNYWNENKDVKKEEQWATGYTYTNP